MDTVVTFANTPGAGIERPSIGLSTLKSVLANAGVGASIHYANIWYAEFVGLDLHNTLLAVHSGEGLFDWLFSFASFPEFEPDHDEYLKRLFQRAPRLANRTSAAQLVALRERTTQFIDTAAIRILSGGTKIVGCTSTFGQHVAALALLREVHILDPSVVTVMGGANCESRMGLATHRLFPWIDFVVSGEADELITPLIAQIVEHGRKVPAKSLPEAVFAPVHREIGYPSLGHGDGVPRASVADMKSVPRPDYREYFSQLQQSSFRDRVRPGLLIETSRGCWWGERSHCTFCGLNGGSMQFRSKTPESVLAELRAASIEYGTSRFEAVDNILDLHYVEAVFGEVIKANESFELFYEMKSNLKRHQIELSARAGVRWIQPGIESLDTRVLQLMRKGCSGWQNVALLKWCRQFGIRTFWNFIYGTPGETDEWYAEQADFLPLLEHFEPGRPVELQYCRYSPYHSNPLSFGLDLIPSRAYERIYPVARDDLSDLVYFFEERSGGQRAADDLPGAAKFMSALFRWREAWRQEKVPVCSLVRRDGEYIVADTRSCAKQALTPLDELSVTVLAAAESGILWSQLTDKVGATSRGWGGVEECARKLAERGFLLKIDGRWLSLVLRAPISPLPDDANFPGGSFVERMESN